MRQAIIPGTVPQDIRAYAGATGRDLHIDVPLTNITIGYQPQGLIAPLIYPIVPVTNETGNYYTWAKGETLRLHSAQRARGAAAARISFDVSSEGYAVKNYALAVDIPAEDMANADAVLNIGGGASQLVVNGLNLAWEDRLAVTLTTTTNMTSSTALAAANAWNDPTGGDPIGDFYVGRDAIRKISGFSPNVWVQGDHAWSRFSRHPDVIEFTRGRGDTKGGGPVNEAQAAAALGLDRIVVGKGIKNTAAEGLAATYTDIWSTAAILLYVAPSPGIMQPSHGYTFRWTPPGLPGALAAERYTNQREHTESVEVHQFQDEKVTGTDLGYLIVGT